MAVIHNYLLDGGAENVDVVDDGSYAPAMAWYKNWGNEALSLVIPGNASAHALSCVTTGASWYEGPSWGALYNAGFDKVPAGTYQIAVDARSPDGPLSCLLQVSATDRVNGAPTDRGSVVTPVVVGTGWSRIATELTTTGVGWVNINLMLDPTAYSGEPSPLVITFVLDNAMMTEGDATIFADGDSPGWSWAGTAHASASSGEQPVEAVPVGIPGSVLALGLGLRNR